MSTYKDLKDFTEKNNLTYENMALALTINGYKISQPTLTRFYRDQKTQSDELPRKLSNAFELVVRKQEMGILENHLKIAKQTLKTQKNDLYPIDDIGQLPVELIESDDSKQGRLDPKKEKDTVMKMASVGMSEENKEKVKNGFYDYWKRFLSKIPFAANAYALYLFVTKVDDIIRIAPAVGALLYFISPIDLIPDYIPFVGFVDDAAVIAAVCAYLDKEIEPYMDEAKSEIEKINKSP